jgi:hypothetical protein
MPVVKFTPDRQPRRDGEAVDAAMSVWQVMLLLIDWLTQNYVNLFKVGSSTVPAGLATVIVAHGLGSSAYRVAITPTVDPTLRWWVSNKTAVQFQMNLSAVAPAGGVSFDWIVKGD